MAKDDWSVPWPDGSWLKWNDETGSWEKQEGSPPPAQESSEGSGAPTAREARSKTVSPKQTTAKKTTAPKTSSKKTSSTKAAAGTSSGGAAKPVKPSSTAQPKARVPEESGGSGAWRPIANLGEAPPVSERVVPRAPVVVDDRPWAPPPRRRAPAFPNPLMPALVAGCAAGVVAGALLFFLIR